MRNIGCAELDIGSLTVERLCAELSDYTDVPTDWKSSGTRMFYFMVCDCDGNDRYVLPLGILATILGPRFHPSLAHKLKL